MQNSVQVQCKTRCNSKSKFLAVPMQTWINISTVSIYCIEIITSGEQVTVSQPYHQVVYWYHLFRFVKPCLHVIYKLANFMSNQAQFHFRINQSLQNFCKNSCQNFKLFTIFKQFKMQNYFATSIKQALTKSKPFRLWLMLLNFFKSNLGQSFCYIAQLKSSFEEITERRIR